MKKTAHFRPALLAGLILLSPLASAEDGGLQLSCGGIGEDESARLLAEATKHSLTIIFTATDGSYLSDVQTEINGPRDIVIKEDSCGPIGQVDVGQAGRYKVQARYAERSQEKILSLKPGGGQRLVLRWKAE